MKRKGNKSDFTADRNAELRAAFFNQEIYNTSDAVMIKTVRTPASRFWVDPYRARDVLSRYEKNPDSITSMNPERQRMYKVLYEKYKELRSQFPTDTKIKLTSMAVYSQAPEFFLSPATACTIIYSF